MKIIALGDTHGRAFWKYVVNTQEFDKIVFIGDYFDSFDIKGDEQIRNFQDIIEYKKNNLDKVELLIGNHDHHYFRDIGYTGTSGYQGGINSQIEFVLEDAREYLNMAYAHEDILFTHAGVGESWLEKYESLVLDQVLLTNETRAEEIAYVVNEVWKNKPQVFIFNGRDSYGDDMGQTPIWIRPRSLMKDCQHLKKHIIQVVGHTGQLCIDIKGKSTGGRYYFIDTLGSSREYLIIEDGEFKTGKV